MGFLRRLLGGPNQPAVTVTVKASTSRYRDLDNPPPVLHPADVAKLPVRPDGLPSLPPRPSILDDFASASTAYVSVEDRPYARTTCPSCEQELTPLPKAKKRCPSCRQDIFVRSGPDNKRHLLSAGELPAFEQEWQDYSLATALEQQAERERGQSAWDKSLRKLGILRGDNWIDVVGESHYQPALAALMDRWRSRPGQTQVLALAELRREPTNPYDPNAIEVLIDEVLVGYLSRWEAESYQSLLRRMEGNRRRAFIEATMIGGAATADGFISVIGVQLRGAPDAD